MEICIYGKIYIYVCMYMYMEILEQMEISNLQDPETPPTRQALRTPPEAALSSCG